MSDTNPAPETVNDARLPALLAWRQQLIDSEAISARTLKEAHLRLVLRSGRSDVEQIRAMLPGAVSEHAESLAALLAELDADPPPPPAGRHRSGPGDGPAAEGVEQTAMISVANLSTPPPRKIIETDLSSGDFAPFAFGPSHGHSHAVTIVPRHDTAGATTGRQLSWPAFLPSSHGGESVVVYRVISAEESRPYSPDRADVVAITTDTEALDVRPPGRAVRHFQVWVNSGPTRSAALAAQPELHAEGVLISPVAGVSVREDHGRVIGQWTVPPGVEMVHVHRIPAEVDGRDGPQFRILATSDNLGGFVDTEAVGGQRYTYRMRCAATVDGIMRLSEAAQVDIEMAAVLSPVTDLVVTPSGPGVFDLTWTPPRNGVVVIYRSQDGPRAGADAAELPEAALDQIGLSPDMRLTQPMSQRTDGSGRVTATMTGVSWPSAWSRSYFTPVTVLAGTAALGATQSAVRTGEIRDVELAEYCNKQVITFDWPSGAAAVVVHLAPRGHDPRNGLTGKKFEISLEEYEKYGGMHLAGQLPVTGCSLHLAPVAFTRGQRVLGAVRSIDYEGLLRLQYAIRIGRDDRGVPTHATVAMRSEHDLPGSPAFVLVHNASRIPLSVSDGTAVDVAPVDEQGRLTDAPSKELRWSALTTHGNGELWAANLRDLTTGWLRLFVNTPSPARLRTIALLDPPVESLRLFPMPPGPPQ
ncbi:fibronectin type III domain-containing protein [Mycolicibacterium confluentis]|uniref:Putative ESX-1 scaffolding and assembly protein SaeA n=1 Tax=Mycolicibacterium confluentis TaxID=28047 RepID=A0A7I7Y2W1_9MYCO|nr:hypothetical protein [Mycolicibacterium confluentis]MCV7318100.1 hypothetical protein [Mycolicibacterium confluentis]ORV31195.1 hypothetical protein AWB99_12315 [Mycolicibacterium confluentis]BBZ36008.1 putative ESX-1 scaffolding and assembly protein SaeA [Mycolicibacterium confluentis]